MIVGSASSIPFEDYGMLPDEQSSIPRTSRDLAGREGAGRVWSRSDRRACLFIYPIVQYTIVWSRCGQQIPTAFIGWPHAILATSDSILSGEMR